MTQTQKLERDVWGLGEAFANLHDRAIDTTTTPPQSKTSTSTTTTTNTTAEPTSTTSSVSLNELLQRQASVVETQNTQSVDIDNTVAVNDAVSNEIDVTKSADDDDDVDVETKPAALADQVRGFGTSLGVLEARLMGKSQPQRQQQQPQSQVRAEQQQQQPLQLQQQQQQPQMVKKPTRQPSEARKSVRERLQEMVKERRMARERESDSATNSAKNDMLKADIGKR